jgi:hypothetical protein
LLCAPFEDPHTLKDFDLRFVSDSEILCQKHKGRIGVYHTNRAEIEMVNSYFKPGPDESVFYMAFKNDEEAELGINKFVYMHNSMFENKLSGLLPKHLLNNRLFAAIISRNEKQKFEDLLKTFKNDTHDKIPNSYIGALIKNGELSTLNFLVNTSFILYTPNSLVKLGDAAYEDHLKSFTRKLPVYNRKPLFEAINLEYTPALNKFWKDVEQSNSSEPPSGVMTVLTEIDSNAHNMQIEDWRLLKGKTIIVSKPKSIQQLILLKELSNRLGFNFEFKEEA